MIDYRVKNQFLNLFNNYPIGFTGSPEGIKREKSKMVLVAKTIENTHGLNADAVLEKMCLIRGYNLNTMPNLETAAYTLGVSIPNFLMDYGKIQYLYETHPVMEQLPMLLMQV